MSEENNVEKPLIEDDSPTLLKVAGSKGRDKDKENVKKLANAILQVLSKHNIAHLRCVGAAAVNNAEKAFIIASGESAKTGQVLVCKSYFVNVDFQGEVKTGILKEIAAQ